MEQPAEIGSAVSQDSPRRGGPRDRRGQFDQKCLGLAIHRLRLPGPSDDLEQEGDGRQAARHVGLDLRVGMGAGRQRLSGGEDLAVGRQRVLRLPDVAGQLGQLEVCLQHRLPGRPVRVVPQQRPQLAVEVAGRLEQPVAQVLEHFLLEEEVLGDAGVERLDRLDRELVPLLHAGLLGGQLGISSLHLGVGRPQAAVGLGLNAGDGDQARRHRRPGPPPRL